MTKVLNERVADAVCATRHPLEWSSPRPRASACGECRQILALVLSKLRLIVGKTVTIG